MSNGSPPAIAWPPSSVSQVAVLMNETTGVVYRSISSTAVGSEPAVLGSRPHCPGVGQRDEPARKHVAGRLVSGHQQLHEEHRQLVVAQLVPLDRDPGQLREHVVFRLGPSLLRSGRGGR